MGYTEEKQKLLHSYADFTFGEGVASQGPSCKSQCCLQCVVGSVVLMRSTSSSSSKIYVVNKNSSQNIECIHANPTSVATA